MIIPANINHPNLEPMAIGIAVQVQGQRQHRRVPNSSDMEKRWISCLAVKYGADTLMDLSTGGGDLDRFAPPSFKFPHPHRHGAHLPGVGERPRQHRKLTADDFLHIIEKHAQQGVDYMTIHAGILIEHLPLVRDRITGIVSRGGGILARWMLHHHQQNPLYTHFDDIIEIFKKYDVSFSLGDSLRPGCLHDATDAAQLAELKTLGNSPAKPGNTTCR
jgi:phosphomethylpyrimidine synthase